MDSITTEDTKTQSSEFKLEKENELRVEVDKESSLEVELLNGMAEIFGTELVRRRKYIFKAGSKFAIFTWHGCTIGLRGGTEFAYISTETPMVMYLNIHVALEQLRTRSELDKCRGPRVMVAGAKDVGKSTFCRLLSNYALRVGRSPMFVDLDIGQASVSIPGTLGAVVRERPTELDETFPQESCLVLHYGHISPSENVELYKHMVSQLAEYVKLKTEKSAKCSHSGVIMNTCGWVRDEGYKCLLHIAGAFEVDVVVILDNERLYSQLQDELPKFVRVVHLPKSGGIIDRSHEARVEARDRCLREYFYGSHRVKLNPHAFEIPFGEISIYKIGAPQISEALAPVGESANPLMLMPVQPNQRLIHCVLSVVCPPPAADADKTEGERLQALLGRNVYGFIVINHVDMKRKVYHVLSPCPRPLPSSVLLLMGEGIRFLDTSGVRDWT